MMKIVFAFLAGCIYTSLWFVTLLFAPSMILPAILFTVGLTGVVINWKVIKDLEI